MDIEGLSQILDAASFILVTPEFLGEQRFTKFRLLLDKYIDKISYGFLDLKQDQSRRQHIGALSSQIIGIFIFTVILWLLGDRDVWWAQVIRVVVVPTILLTIISFMITLFAVFLIAVENLAVRGLLFAIGSITFFMSRHHVLGASGLDFP